MYGVWSWVWEQILPATLSNVNVTFLVQSHTDTSVWLVGGGGGGIRTFMPGGFCDVNALSVQPSPFGAC